MALYVALHRHNAPSLLTLCTEKEYIIGEDRYGIPCFGDEVAEPWLSLLLHNSRWILLRYQGGFHSQQLHENKVTALSVGDSQIVLLPVTASYGQVTPL